MVGDEEDLAALFGFIIDDTQKMLSSLNTITSCLIGCLFEAGIDDAKVACAHQVELECSGAGVAVSVSESTVAHLFEFFFTLRRICLFIDDRDAEVLILTFLNEVV